MKLYLVLALVADVAAIAAVSIAGADLSVLPEIGLVLAGGVAGATVPAKVAPTA